MCLYLPILRVVHVFCVNPKKPNNLKKERLGLVLCNTRSFNVPKPYFPILQTYCALRTRRIASPLWKITPNRKLWQRKKHFTVWKNRKFAFTKFIQKSFEKPSNLVLFYCVCCFHERFFKWEWNSHVFTLWMYNTGLSGQHQIGAHT